MRKRRQCRQSVSWVKRTSQTCVLFIIPKSCRHCWSWRRKNPLLQASSPELYRGYEERKVSNVSDYGDVVATVEEVHRFPVDDAIVLFGHIENKGAKTVSFDPAAIKIGIGDRQYPSAFVDCASAVKPGQTIRVGVIGQGDVDGGRAHLAIRNTFRVLLPKYSAPASSPAPAQHPKGLSESTPVHRRGKGSNKAQDRVKAGPSPRQTGHPRAVPWEGWARPS